MSPPVARRSIKVAESVARDIIRDAAQLPPNSTLPGEAAMLAQYGVSRGSLREALRILEAQGLISIKPGPGGGPVLVGANPESLARMQSLHFHLMGATYRDLVVARVHLEPQMVRMAAERSDREALDRLKEFIPTATPDSANDTEYLDHSKEFHQVVCSLSGNPVLDMLAESLQHIVHYRVRTAVFAPELRDEVIMEHANIAQAVLDGDGPKAEQLMNEHMARFAGSIIGREGLGTDEIVDWA